MNTYKIIYNISFDKSTRQNDIWLDEESEEAVRAKFKKEYQDRKAVIQDIVSVTLC
jgi:hypothetical protein